jgi:hypothetical protein
LPGPEIRPEEAAGAALAELVRYIFYLGFIVWVGFSKKLKHYFTSEDGTPNKHSQQDAAQDAAPLL